MNLFVFGMLAGVIVAIIFMGVVKIKDDRTVDQGQLNNDSSMDDSDSGIDSESRNVGIHWYTYPEKSVSRQVALETLVDGLWAMQTILGLSRRENEMLEDAALYIEEHEGL